MRTIILTPEEGGWVAEVPSLRGCISQGETRAEALENIREAIEVYIESLEAEGLPAPPMLTWPDGYFEAVIEQRRHKDSDDRE